jgi:hypothetical protein
MACADVEADISALFTGIHSNITATDQIRPIATTTAIPMHVRILPSTAQRPPTCR